MRRRILWLTGALLCWAAIPWAYMAIFATSWRAYYAFAVWLNMDQHLAHQGLAGATAVAVGFILLMSGMWCIMEQRWPWESPQ